jgi:hypothetical protein
VPSALRTDRTAIVLSVLCLVHCLGLPIAISLLPALSHLLDVPEEVHAILFLFAAPVSAFAIATGYRRHGLFLPAATAIVALALIGLGAFGELSVVLETGVSVLGSLLLAGAHIANLRAERRRAWHSAEPKLS